MAQQDTCAEGQVFTEAYEQQVRSLGCVNILVAGATGAGKSTLINSIFSGDVCKTGIGSPVTEDTTYYLHPTGAAGFYDTRGIEFGESRDRILKWLRKEVQDRSRRTLNEQIHVAWYLVRASDLRLDEGQIAFIKELAKLKLQVALVMTKVPRSASTGEIHPDALVFAAHLEALDLPVIGGRPILTAAIDDPFGGFETHGLEDLLNATADALPAELLDALHSTQWIDLKVKRDRAASIIHTSAIAAAAAGFIPVPGADLAALVPIETQMVARISALYGLPVSTGQLVGLVAPLVLGGGIVKIAASFLRSALKVIPGAEIVVGPISAAAGAVLTETIGWAWVLVMEQVLITDPSGKDMPSSNQMRDMFKNAMKRKPPQATSTALAVAA